MRRPLRSHTTAGAWSHASSRLAAEARQSSTISPAGRRAPCSMSCSRPGAPPAYWASSSPSAAPRRIRTKESALRARWVSTCPTLQPGSRLARAATRSSTASSPARRRPVASRQPAMSRAISSLAADGTPVMAGSPGGACTSRDGQHPLERHAGIGRRRLVDHDPVADLALRRARRAPRRGAAGRSGTSSSRGRRAGRARARSGRGARGRAGRRDGSPCRRRSWIRAGAAATALMM